MKLLPSQKCPLCNKPKHYGICKLKALEDKKFKDYMKSLNTVRSEGDQALYDNT